MAADFDDHSFVITKFTQSLTAGRGLAMFGPDDPYSRAVACGTGFAFTSLSLVRVRDPSV
jgi:hypothetical protein